MKNTLLCIFTVACINSTVIADEVDILSVAISDQGQNNYHFNVTLQHQDTGWEHYADGWRIVDEQNNILGTRVLYHPHVNEQPFTRGLNNVNISPNTPTIYVEAHDNVHGWSTQRLRIDLRQLQDGKLIVKAQ